MRALQSHQPGGPDTLTMDEVAAPEVGKGELLIGVKACAINFPDALIIQDLYQMRPQRPFAPGSEVAGIVEAVGEGVSDYAVGDRVIAGIGFGGLVEQVKVPAAAVYRLPEQFSFEQGASLLMTYGTSIHALKDRGHIKAGETLLVLGAAGGVGLAAVELGKAYGARVVAAVSSEEKAAMAMASGADATVIYDRQPFDKAQSKALSQQFKDAVGPAGADIIYDAVGGDYSEPAVRSIAWEGRFLVVGFPAGIAKLSLNLTLLKSCDVCGVFWGAFTAREPQRNAANIQELFDLWEAGKISPKISETYAFEDAHKAIAKLADRQAMGKLVVKI